MDCGDGGKAAIKDRINWIYLMVITTIDLEVYLLYMLIFGFFIVDRIFQWEQLVNSFVLQFQMFLEALYITKSTCAQAVPRQIYWFCWYSVSFEVYIHIINTSIYPSIHLSIYLVTYHKHTSTHKYKFISTLKPS